MSIVKINAIEIPEGAGPELEARFAARAGAVENQPGFERFQLLRPLEGESRYFVVTWWADEESFQGWMSSQDFAKGHANAGPPAGSSPGAGSEGHSEGQAHSGGQALSGAERPGGVQGHGGDRPAVATGSSLLSFEVVEEVGPAGG
ncbi:MAG: antibiotic biosynthesis monooxygenase family protein [Microthrixaceae bacterium]